MKRATWVEGFVLIALGMILLGGVLLNLALTNYEGQWINCTTQTSPPAELPGVGEYQISPSFSLLPLGFNCEYSYPPSEESATVFLDQGTVPAIFGIALTWIGAGVLIGGAALARRAD